MSKGIIQTVDGGLTEYFRERLHACSQVFTPPPLAETLWYISTLLTRFVDSQQLYSFDDGRLQLRPLALLYKDAHEASNGQERCLILRQLGDQALFIGALFPERYARKGLKQDYFVGMGSGAFDYLADHAQGHRDMFAELASRFVLYLELIFSVCSDRSSRHDQHIMALYDAWLKNGNANIAQQLQAFGIQLDKGNHEH